MVATMAGRVSLLHILTFCAVTHSALSDYHIPDVKIEVFTPKGFRVSIPDAPRMGLFVFQGNVNRKIDSSEVGDIAGEALAAVDGRWTVDLPDVELKVRDLIKYHVFVSIDGAGYLLDGQEYQVRELKQFVELPKGVINVVWGTSTPVPPVCRPTATRLRFGQACAGQTIFEDTFDSFSDSLWQVEQYIPKEHPEVPYVSYQSSAVTVEGGHLRITPSLQQNQPGWSRDTMYSGELNLMAGCTESLSSLCNARSEGVNIIPPVVSGRVTTRNHFAFTYGTVSVRAKLPIGDWLYPEILLEPLVKKYGFGALNFKSGLLKIAAARGNKSLYAGSVEYANRVLYGGPILENQCRLKFLSRKQATEDWGNSFHVYSVKWTPDNITLFVDGEQWGVAAPAPGARGLRGSMTAACRGDDAPGLSPFDDHFYLTLGVAAGGVTDFLNKLYSDHETSKEKPWENQEAKATLKFWQAADAWYPTWEQPQLLVDYVKVVAL